MPIERAVVRAVPKPWGVVDPSPWHPGSEDLSPIGELRFERRSPPHQPTLLLKLLLTSQPLSIQVHPDDAFARLIGLPCGKSEAWYILAAAPGSRVAVGLKEPCSKEELRSSIADGSIGSLVSWHAAASGDAFDVPAGTIHAIGSGLVIAEIQQNSDATFRLLDIGLNRELHVDNGLAVAETGVAAKQLLPARLSDERLLLVANNHFVFERVDLPPGSIWRLAAEGETWIVLLAGRTIIGAFELAVGEAIFADDASVSICSGDRGMRCLIAYVRKKGANPKLLRRSNNQFRRDRRPNASRTPSSWLRMGQLAARIRSWRIPPIKYSQRIALIGNYLPRRCGIATFTHDLNIAITKKHPEADTMVIAMTNSGGAYDYPECVRFQIPADQPDEYRRAAAFLNSSDVGVVSLQHEFGIFGGEAGSHILGLLAHLEAPVVTTLHTILDEPSAAQRVVMDRVIASSERLVVMSNMGRDILIKTYGIETDMIDTIPHGIPDVPFQDTAIAKAKFGLSAKTVILTFGLLSPSKGIEMVIDAMPAIIKACPTAIYVVLGATHPNLVREQGEVYRESLVTRMRALGVQDHVLFFDQFVDQATLLDFIAMCDIYVTPYLNEAQMTSGTLAYSYGSGKAVVSTPYWHAKELLADGRGILVPFGDSNSIGSEIASLLGNDVRRHAMRKRAYSAGRSMIWAEAAGRYLATYQSAAAVRTAPRPILTIPSQSSRRAPDLALPQLRTTHLLAMCDLTGLLQHAIHSVPDRSHGYCVDDNARGLLLASTLDGAGEAGLPDLLTTRMAAFVAHAWNEDTKRFRNFMSYDRRWLEDKGSEDSHGRTLWALAACASDDADASRRRWAIELFRKALPTAREFNSPRAWAFTLLALDQYCPLARKDIGADQMRRQLADRLLAILESSKRDDWFWFEDVLGYDNARLSQALILTGIATDTPAYSTAGLETLRWLMDRQTGSSGCFRPVGSDSFGKPYAQPEPFDQQPIEAAASIAAYLAAARLQAGPEWEAAAMSAFNWFLGENDLCVTLADRHSGACLDGLHPDRPNGNMGAELVLSYLLALTDIRRLVRVGVAPAESARTQRLPVTA